MATTINGSTTTQYWTFKIVATEGTPNIEANTSPLTVDLYVGRHTVGSYMSYPTIKMTVSVTGAGSKSYTLDSYDDYIWIDAGGWYKIGSLSFPSVPHDDDGSKTVTVSASFTNDIKPASGSASGSVVLTTIARASQPSCITWPEHTENVGNFGDTISIHMNRKSDSFTHTVRYAYGDLTGTIATNVTTGTTWTIPESFMDLIPESTSGQGRIYVDTYNGSTLIGTKYCGFRATVPSSVKPTLSVTLTDTTGVDDIYSSPVKGLSKIKVTPSVTLGRSSPIAEYSITIDGVTYNTATVTTGALQRVGSSPVSVTVKDKRGRTASWSYTMNVQDYASPRITALAVHRTDANMVEDDQGTHATVTFSAAVSSMNSKNRATYVLEYKKTTETESAYREIDLSALANNYNVTNYAIPFQAEVSASYDVRLTVTDRHGSAVRTTSVSTAFSLMDWHNSGTGLRFGGVAELENTLQNDLSLRQTGNRYAFQPDAFGGAGGYICLAEITLSAVNVNAPVVFEIIRRGALGPMRVFVCFASSSETTDPGLGSISYEGTNYGAFLVKKAESIWRLYVDNTTGGSNPCLQAWYTTENQKARLSVSFPNEQIEGDEPNVLGTYYRATPAELDNLRDYIYPVGSIYFSYSHVSPAELFGGTWTRIENRFLWATTPGGTIGQTGGASTHTLTVNEMPSHQHHLALANTGTEISHGLQWLNEGSTRRASWQIGYEQATGGGAAHNNMPPYMQVSAWRRTA